MRYWVLISRKKGGNYRIGPFKTREEATRIMFNNSKRPSVQEVELIEEVVEELKEDQNDA